jgi:hypothetical protein
MEEGPSAASSSMDISSGEMGAEMSLAGSIGALTLDNVITDNYEGAMEWSDADQELFDQAVDLHGLAEAVDAIFAEAPDQPSADDLDEVHGRLDSTPAANPETAYDYSTDTSEIDPKPLISEDIFNPFFLHPENLSEGIWLSSLVEADNDEQHDMGHQPARPAAIKYMAAELGLAAEDVLVKEDDELRQDTLIKAHHLDDLPSEPQKMGDVYVCEGRILSEREAIRVMAARTWAGQASGSPIKINLREAITALIHAMGRPDYAMAVTYKEPDEEAVRVTAKPSAIVPKGSYEHLRTEDGDTILARVDTPDPSPLPVINRASRLMGYSVDQYEYIGGTDGRHTYDAILERP